jgi:acyl-CoA synthetase (AMP-forming)/AMP-acid ligase II
MTGWNGSIPPPTNTQPRTHIPHPNQPTNQPTHQPTHQPGASPISAEVMQFLRICFSCSVLEGYGMTETACTISITRMDDPTIGHVSLLYKLTSCCACE